ELARLQTQRRREWVNRPKLDRPISCDGEHALAIEGEATQSEFVFRGEGKQLLAGLCIPKSSLAPHGKNALAVGAEGSRGTSLVRLGKPENLLPSTRIRDPPGFVPGGCKYPLPI